MVDDGPVDAWISKKWGSVVIGWTVDQISSVERLTGKQEVVGWSLASGTLFPP